MPPPTLWVLAEVESIDPNPFCTMVLFHTTASFAICSYQLLVSTIALFGLTDCYCNSSSYLT
jgi:hypothetical protein